jgi:hypothetical protein
MFASEPSIRRACAGLALALSVASYSAGALATYHKPPAPPVKESKPLAPTGLDCQKKAEAAAEKVRREGGTDKEQQAAYVRAKHNCRDKM